MKRILCVTAHADDECVALWPIFQESDKYQLALLVLSRNIHKGSGPWDALQEVCVANGVQMLRAPRGPNQFYRLPTRHAAETLSDAVGVFREAIARMVSDFHPDAIFTHNPWGEYGHGDHRMCFNLAAELEIPLLLTDMCMTNACHLSTAEIPHFYRPLFQNPIRSCTLDEAWYERMKAIYEKSNAWTWGGHEPVRKANLYLFGK